MVKQGVPAVGADYLPINGSDDPDMPAHFPPVLHDGNAGELGMNHVLSPPVNSGNSGYPSIRPGRVRL